MTDRANATHTPRARRWRPRGGRNYLLKVLAKPPFPRDVQSFAEVLADEMARLDMTEVPPAAAFAPPASSFDSGLRAAMATMGAAFFVPLLAVAPPPALTTAPVVVAAPEVRREGSIDGLLRRFREQHVAPAIVAMELRLLDE